MIVETWDAGVWIPAFAGMTVDCPPHLALPTARLELGGALFHKGLDALGGVAGGGDVLGEGHLLD